MDFIVHLIFFGKAQPTGSPTGLTRNVVRKSEVVANDHR
jgi:hypothetical protein